MGISTDLETLILSRVSIGLKISKNVICIRWSSNTSFSPWKCFHHDTFILEECMESKKWGHTDVEYEKNFSSCKLAEDLNEAWHPNANIISQLILPFPSTKVMQNASFWGHTTFFAAPQQLYLCNNSNWVKYSTPSATSVKRNLTPYATTKWSLIYGKESCPLLKWSCDKSKLNSK